MSVEDVLDFAKTINSSGRHLLDIVDDIFDITLIESGGTKIKKREKSLHAILTNVNDIIKTEQKKTEKDKLIVNLIYPEKKNDLIIKTDPAKLKQILINLLKNALKFTNDGHIKFGYNIETDDNKPVIKFFVEDTGIGIPVHKQKLIFDTFRQGDDSSTRLYGGTGIGLSISRKLTELLGGKIWLKSETEKGTVFYFTIPFEGYEVADTTSQTAATTKPTTSAELKNKFENKTILIVEDDEPSFSLLEILLNTIGVNTIWAQNGKTAITYCQDNPHIDLVLMDINMPIMNGYETTREIKKFKPDLPIIAQTAYAIFGDREKSLQAGCDDYISKPINRKKLMNIIEKYCIAKEL